MNPLHNDDEKLNQPNDEVNTPDEPSGLKPSNDNPPLPPRAPFVVGITGNVDPLGYDDDRAACDASEQMQHLKKKITNILTWITSKDRRLDPHNGELREADKKAHSNSHKSDPWLSLGMQHTPILVLSSLAPGADTIVAETVLEYARTNPRVSLAAPLPFPEEIYANSSTFKENHDTKVARYREILDGIRAQPNPGFIFSVALDNDLMPPGKTAHEAAEDDLFANDLTYGEPRRRLRYRAAGEYIAVHSDLLIAIYDEPHDLLPSEHEKEKTTLQRKQDRIANIFEAGTATIVEAKRRGLTHELLAVANNFAWADNGPVLHIPVARQKRERLTDEDRMQLPPPGSMRFLHPYDLKPENVSEADDQNPAWQAKGDTRFRRVLVRQDAFNQLAEDKGEKNELAAMTSSLTSPLAKDFAARLAPIARIRRRAANEANKLEAKRKSLLISMFRLIFAAATLYGCFEHWHHYKHHIHESHEWIFWPDDYIYLPQILLLAGSFYCLYLSGKKYLRHHNSGDEEKRFDYRAIGEALRVQFFWKLAGTGRSVAADYMQRQRDELDWIRYVVSSLSMPHETTRAEFLALPRASQVQLLETTRKKWLGVQIAYFLGTPEKLGNAQQQENKAHFWHTCGRILASAGLTCMFFMLIAKCIPAFKTLLATYPFVSAHILIWSGLLLIGRKYYKTHFKKSSPESHHPHTNHSQGGNEGFKEVLAWVFSCSISWGSALFLVGLVTGASFASGLWKDFHYWPDSLNWWIILTGTLLLGGALCVAWAEKNFYAEQARQYRAMGELFVCADRRLENLIARYEKPSTTGPAADRILFEIHDILHQLGCEALDENAEWLIQHRARPLEMLMAG